MIFLPELSYTSLVPRFSLPPEAAVAPPLTVLGGGGSVLKKKRAVLSAFVQSGSS